MAIPPWRDGLPGFAWSLSHVLASEPECSYIIHTRCTVPKYASNSITRSWYPCISRRLPLFSRSQYNVNLNWTGWVNGWFFSSVYHHSLGRQSRTHRRSLYEQDPWKFKRVLITAQEALFGNHPSRFLPVVNFDGFWASSTFHSMARRGVSCTKAPGSCSPNTELTISPPRTAKMDSKLSLSP